MSDRVFKYPNVVGWGYGRRNYDQTGEVAGTDEVISVLVTDKLPLTMLAAEEVVPRELEGMATDVRQVGVIRAQQDPKDRLRPAPGGSSIGHFAITAGTLGAAVLDRDGKLAILSNNHVLANSNEAAIGDDILQPGPIDGGRYPEDRIALLAEFVPIGFSGGGSPVVGSGFANALAGVGNAILGLLNNPCTLSAECPENGGDNLVDAALANPVDGSLLDAEILEIGSYGGTQPAAIGLPVRKSGRTTGLTFGEIEIIGATVDVSYGGGRTARFRNQLITGDMSEGGDSGSLLVTMDTPAKAVGLLFAGSPQVTIYNPIDAVIAALGITF